MSTLCYTCRDCDAPTAHRDSIGSLCPWCAEERNDRHSLTELAFIAKAAHENAGRPRWAGRFYASIAPRFIEGGYRVW